MKIVVAGFNVDKELIERARTDLGRQDAWTPETISAAYARISRDPRPVAELRREAGEELEKARRSNKAIVFDMGHSSIAEHAVFNLDIMGVSRLLAEEIEKFRLSSYTEKSQRYVLLSDDLVVPQEIAKAGWAEDFIALIRRQNRLYRELYERLRGCLLAKYPEELARPGGVSLVEGWAKEDARYTVSLAAQTQLGLTVNARNLELMLRRLAAHPLAEAREYAKRLSEATHSLAPSLIRYIRATDYDTRTRPGLEDFFQDRLVTSEPPAPEGRPPRQVELLWSTPEADLKILAALAHSASRRPFSVCLEQVKNFDEPSKMALVKTACRWLESYDAVLREFEYGELAYELILSASCFAQLKRHRMATITAQGYDPGLGYTVPQAVSEVGLAERFGEVMAQTEGLYKRIAGVEPAAAPYILTNAHRRRVMIKVNARELYHMARLRCDRHAQWEIREIVQGMLDLAREAMPLTLLFASGKDRFPELKDRLSRGDLPPSLRPPGSGSGRTPGQNG